jgi:HEAT repeat protein
MAIKPNARAARILVGLAATHSNPQIRRSAGWVVEELAEALVEKTMLELLPRSEEDVQAYVLVKMGHRKLSACGQAIANILTHTSSARLRTSALDGLGFLGEKRFLPDVVPHLLSDDPMTAYVATLAAVQMINLLEDAPTLKEILLLKGDEKAVLKQVVLQYMIDAVAWNFTDPSLVEVLRTNLDSPNTNIRYLSIILMGRSKSAEYVPDLIELLVTEQDSEICKVALESLNEGLAGDMHYFLDAIEDANGKPVLQLALLKLVMDLNLNRESANMALAHLEAMVFDDRKQELWQALDQIAQTVYRASPEATRDFFSRNRERTSWRLALGKAWLASLDLDTPEGREDWHILFAEPSPVLMRDAAKLVAAHESRWAVSLLLDKIASLDEPELTADLRHAAKTILKF